MATNHTTNYQLNLWEPTDKFSREEINENTQKLDAVFGPDNLPWVTGTYQGTGTGKTQHITLGFRPTFLFIVYGASFALAASHNGVTQQFGSYSADSTKTVIRSDAVAVTDDGFTVSRGSDYAHNSVNNAGTNYIYFAIR